MACLLLCGFLAVLHTAWAQVSCPGLGDFNPTGPFVGWPDPTCPGDSGLELQYRMFNRRDPLGRDFDRNDVPFIFEPDDETIFIIHDHGEDHTADWLRDMRAHLVDERQINVVSVGWGGPEGAEDSDYWRAASDTRTVGAETAEVMMNLVISGGSSAIRMHFIGHGLGAHVAGHAGRWADVSDLLPQRISGLDPSGPHFANNSDRTVGLFRDCANFVDVIHTDQSLGSTPLPGGFDMFLGDQDFFPNQGITQPGCGDNTCDHHRSYQLYHESISNNCNSAEMVCVHSADIPASCTPCSTCPFMGFHATPSVNGRYTLTTSSDAPYC